MRFVVLAVGTTGHVILWVALVNRLHGTAMNRRWMDALTALCGLAVAGMPLFVLLAIGPDWFDGSADEAPRGAAATAAWAYLWACALIGIAAALHRLWTFLHPERRGVLVGHRATPLAMESGAETSLAGPGAAALLARLPGNQVFDLELHEKELAIPRLAAALDGLRIAHLSDLHMSGRIARAYFEQMAEHVNASRPDLILITGDLVECNECIPWIPDTLGRLDAAGGVYYVRGNHDLRVDQDRLQPALAGAGLVHLGGRAHTAHVRGAPILLAGNELPWFVPAPDLANSDANSVVLRILLAHSPDQFAWAQRHGFHLVLAGHNHGGQVRVPLLGAILAPSRHGVRYACGVFRAGQTVLHVSRGTSSLTPLRYNCPPEIALLVLRSTN